MTLYRSVLVSCMLFIAGLSAVGAQPYPSKMIRIVSPYAPGGGTDIMARTIAQKISENMNVQCIVDNRPGGGGIVGTEVVVKSLPDGYTLLLGSKGPLVVNPALHEKLPYETLRDLAPISLVAIVPAVLVVHPSVPVKSVNDLIALARSRPGQLTFSSSGNGGTGHLSGEQFAVLAKIKLVHVPYRGTGPATVAILSGEISFGFANLVAIAPFVQSNRLRPIAVTSRKRLQASPEIPTVAESGLSAYEYVTWYGVLTTNGTNKDIVSKLNHEIVKISNSTDMKMKLTSEGGEAVSSTPLEFQNYIKSELIEAKKIVKLSGIKLQN